MYAGTAVEGLITITRNKEPFLWAIKDTKNNKTEGKKKYKNNKADRLSSPGASPRAAPRTPRSQKVWMFELERGRNYFINSSYISGCR